MSDKPRAIESLEKENLSAFEGSSFILEHPIERLKYHVEKTGGIVNEMESAFDGYGLLTWSEGGSTFSATAKWPDEFYRVNWKRID